MDRYRYEEEQTIKQRRRMRKRLSSLLEEITGESPDGLHDPQKLLKNTQLAERIARLEMNLAAADITIFESQLEEASYLTSTERDKLIKDAKKRLASASLHLEEHSRLLHMENSLIPKLPGNDHGAAFSDVVHAMFKDQEVPDRRKKRAGMWLRKAEDYYGGRYEMPNGVKDCTWCHITERYVANQRAAHIVPYFLDDGAIPEHLFGEMAHEVDTPTNSLLMTRYLKRWFDEYQIVIVPVDPSESPITRWKIDIISSDIKDSPIDGKELEFLNDHRPSTSFLYFRFMLTLIRIRDKQRAVWENIWARYRTTKPFGTPGRYCRDGTLMAMAAHSKLPAPEETEAFLMELCGPETIPPVVSSEDVINGMRKEMEVIVKCVETVEDEETGEWNDTEDWDSDEDSDEDSDVDEEEALDRI
ncbi:hypothetical protein N0V85_005474, partial [Neurospora sp. IMI 360204]